MFQDVIILVDEQDKLSDADLPKVSYNFLECGNCIYYQNRRTTGRT